MEEVGGATGALRKPSGATAPAPASSPPAIADSDRTVPLESATSGSKRWRAKLASSLLLVSIAAICLGGAAVTVVMRLTLGAVQFPLWPLFAGLGLIAAGGAVILPMPEASRNPPALPGGGSRAVGTTQAPRADSAVLSAPEAALGAPTTGLQSSSLRTPSSTASLRGSSAAFRFGSGPVTVSSTPFPTSQEPSASGGFGARSAVTARPADLAQGEVLAERPTTADGPGSLPPVYGRLRVEDESARGPATGSPSPRPPVGHAPSAPSTERDPPSESLPSILGASSQIPALRAPAAAAVESPQKVGIETPADSAVLGTDPQLSQYGAPPAAGAKALHTPETSTVADRVGDSASMTPAVEATAKLAVGETVVATPVPRANAPVAVNELSSEPISRPAPAPAVPSVGPGPPAHETGGNSPDSSEQARLPARLSEAVGKASAVLPEAVASAQQALAERANRRASSQDLPSWIADLPPYLRLRAPGPSPAGQSTLGHASGSAPAAPLWLPKRVSSTSVGCARCWRPLADPSGLPKCDVCGRPFCGSCFEELRGSAGAVRCPDCSRTDPLSP